MKRTIHFHFDNGSWIKKMKLNEIKEKWKERCEQRMTSKSEHKKKFEIEKQHQQQQHQMKNI